MLAYRADLEQTFNALYNGEPSKFHRLWPRWVIAAEHDKITLWPKKSIANVTDIQYASTRMGFKKPVSEVMADLDAVYDTHSKYNNENTDMKDVKIVVKEPLFQFTLSPRQRMRFQRLTLGTDAPPDLLVKICSFYTSLCGKSNHMAVPPNALKSLEPGLVEIFGSVFNTVGTYCSRLWLEEKYCGSLGSAFDVLPKTIFPPNSTLHINPPFDTTTIDEICTHVDTALENSAYIDIFVVLPCWDNELQEKNGLRNYGEPSNGYRTLQKSKYLFSTTFLDRSNYPYYDHFEESCKYVGHTVLTVLTNKGSESKAKKELECKIEKFLRLWKNNKVENNFFSNKKRL